MAAEIECYVLLTEITQATADDFFGPLSDALRAQGIPLLSIEKERGTQQFELITGLASPMDLAEALASLRHTVEAHGKTRGIDVHFSAKPFAQEPSNGLHLHLHLEDAQGINVFHKTPQRMSDALAFSLGGLLADLPRAMPIFFPQAGDYARLSDTDHVPKIAGWGVNNRYCALRIPMEQDPYHKRIEHRVPCANTNPNAAITAMLEGILRGLRERIAPPPQEFGKFGPPLAAFASA